jgi:uncharacterized membrane protein YkvI
VIFLLKDNNYYKKIKVLDNLKEKNKTGVSTFQIAATYIGTVVGAGFASGQEVLQFFAYYGLSGFLGLILTTLLFIFYGYVILKLGMEYRSRSHLKIIRYAGGKWLSILIDIIITFFLFGALTAMVAGSGAIFYEQFGLPVITGNIFMVVASLFTALLGIGGVISAISFVVPLLLTGVFSLTILSIFEKIAIGPFNIMRPLAAHAPISNWFLSAFVYASYNLVIAVAVLAPLGAEVREKSRLKSGAILGGLGLGIGAMAILFTLLINMPEASRYEIPMVYVAGRLDFRLQIIYSVILLAEVYTTAVGNLYGFAARFVDPGTQRYKWFVVITGIFSLIASQFGFSILVHYLYPVVGYAGLLMLAGLSFKAFQRWHGV